MQDPKKSPKSPSGHHPTTLSGYIFATKACIDKRKKNLLSSNISSTCPHNMVNFGPLAAEIVSLVSDIPGNFNGFRVLAALLHGTLVVGVSQTAAFYRGRPLYSAGRPSRWPTFVVKEWFTLDFVSGAKLFFLTGLLISTDSSSNLCLQFCLFWLTACTALCAMILSSF